MGASITPGCLPLLRGETTDAVFLLEVLSSNSYQLTSSYLLTRHQRAVPLTKIIVHTLYNKHSQGYFRLQAWSFWPMYEDYALQSTGEILTALLLSLGRFPPTTAYMYKRTTLTCTVVNNFNYIFTRIFKILMTMTRNLFLFHPLCFDIVVLLQCKNWRCDSKHKLPISKWHKKRWNVQLLKNGWTIRPSIKLVEGINHQC